MAILNKEDFFNRINTLVGEDNTDENIKIIEDITDTYNNLETLSQDNANWKDKYEENDKEWRKRYRDRFNNTVDELTNDEPDDEPDKPMKYSDLFKEV